MNILSIWKSKKQRRYFIAGGLDLLALAAEWMAVHVPGFGTMYAQQVYPLLSRCIGAVTGLFPFSLVELLLYGLCGLIAADLLLQLRRTLHGRPSCLLRLPGHLFLIGSLLLVLYIFLCGINYHRPGFAREALAADDPSLSSGTSAGSTDTDRAENLTALCRYLVQEINQSAAALQSEAAENASASPLLIYDGMLGQTSDTACPGFRWLRQAGQTGQQAMTKLGERYPSLARPYPYPKPVLNTRLLSMQQTTGVYSPFTVEANYNRDIPYYNIPFTICHELSHLRGYMQEEEANFIAVLATIGAEDLYFNYAGYVSAWVYAGNALARTDPTCFSTIYGEINAATRQDMLYNNAYWAQFEGKAAEAHEQLNDTYLKLNGQEKGVQSYDQVTELMLQYYAVHGSLQ